MRKALCAQGWITMCRTVSARGAGNGERERSASEVSGGGGGGGDRSAELAALDAENPGYYAFTAHFAGSATSCAYRANPPSYEQSK